MQKATSAVAKGNKKPPLIFLYLPNDRGDILLPAVTLEPSSCLLDVIQGKVEEQAPCCALSEADMVWGRTSQIPELGFLCQPAIPVAHPGACWQGKFPKLSTSEVTLITQQSAWKRRSAITFALSHFYFLSDLSFTHRKKKQNKQTNKTGSILSIPTIRETPARPSEAAKAG